MPPIDPVSGCDVAIAESAEKAGSPHAASVSAGVCHAEIVKAGNRTSMNCRFCGSKLEHVVLDLCHTAVANDFLTEKQLEEPEVIYPLKVFVCASCYLVQVEAFKPAHDIFRAEYAYFSSYSKTWLEHVKKYVQHAANRFWLDSRSFVVEIASNDGYLLQYFRERHIPCLGVEPTANTASVAIAKGIPTLQEFFGADLAQKLARENRKADLIVANNVLAHVPDLNGFVRGLKILLKDHGNITAEFPHLLQLMRNRQFDTVYHEHFSYFSLYTLARVFRCHGLEIYEVEELETHGGSLRIYAKHLIGSQPMGANVARIVAEEEDAGINRLESYSRFQLDVDEIKNEFLRYLLGEKKEHKKIAAYGAAAKGNTFLNYCGIKPDIIRYVVDDTPYKQGKFLPQSHIPIVSENALREDRPDIIVILPWNFKEEILSKLHYTKEWGAKLVTAIPRLQIY